MQILFYDDHLEPKPIARSIFLAGPTVRGHGRTPWRATALKWLEDHHFTGTVLIPEFRDADFDAHAARVFGTKASQVPNLRPIAHGVLLWETTGIEQATVVLFWMPFTIGAKDDPSSMPGFTTRAEVSRELARDATRIVLGMPSSAFSSTHIRYHAHHAGVHLHPRLDATLEAAFARLK